MTNVADFDNDGNRRSIKRGYAVFFYEAIRRQKELSDKAWRLFTCLLSHYNYDNRRCNPSAATCGKEIGVSERHVFKLRRELEDKGWVHFEYGNAIFLVGEPTLKDINPVQPDRASSLTDASTLSSLTAPPVQPDSQSLSSGTVAYKEEQYDEQYEVNNTNIGACALSPQNDYLKESSSTKGGPNERGERFGAKQKSRSVNKDSPKSPNHNHPAVVAYRQLYKQISSANATLIAETVGDDLDIWEAFVQELDNAGKKKHSQNITVMTSAFQHYRVGAQLSEALSLAWDKFNGGNNGQSKHATRKTGGDHVQDTLARWNRIASEAGH